MRDRFFTVITIACIACASALAQEKPVAVVTSVSGPATGFSIAHPKGATVGIADVFYAGDRARTAGTLGLIFCPTATAVTLAPGTDVQFTARNISVVKGKIAAERHIPGCSVPVAEVGGPNAHLAGFEMRGDESMVVLRSPVNVTVPAGDLHLRWQPVEGAVTYRVNIQPADGGTAIEQEYSSNEVTVQGSQLKPDTSYRWMVTALAPQDEVLAVSSSRFRTLKPEDALRLEQAARQTDLSDTERHLLIGMLEDQLNMPEQALADFEAIQEKSPSQWLQQQIATLKQRLDSKP